MNEPNEHPVSEQHRQEVQTIIERATAYKGLITVLTRRLEQIDDPVAKIAAADLRNDPQWRRLRRGSRYDLTRRRRARKANGAENGFPL